MRCINCTKEYQIHEVADQLNHESEAILESYAAIIYDWACLTLFITRQKQLKVAISTGNLLSIFQECQDSDISAAIATQNKKGKAKS